MRTFSFSGGLAVALALVLLSAGAQDIANRKELKRADLSGAPAMEVIASVTEFKVGETIPVHSHHGVESAYVLQGATLQKPGKAPVVVATGASIMTLRDVVHGGDTSLKLVTVHVVDKGKPLYEPVGK